MRRLLSLLLLCLFFSSCGPGGIALVAVLVGGGDGEEKPSGPVFRVIEVYPRNGATDVDPKASVLIRFSMMLDGNTVSDTYFQLTENGFVVSSSIVWQSPTEVIIEPDSPLTAGAECTVWVSADVSSIGGQRLGRDFTSNFTVSSENPIDIPLYVVSTVPGEGETIPHPPNIFITFSEAVTGMDATSVTLERLFGINQCVWQRCTLQHQSLRRRPTG